MLGLASRSGCLRAWFFRHVPAPVLLRMRFALTFLNPMSTMPPGSQGRSTPSVQVALQLSKSGLGIGLAPTRRQEKHELPNCAIRAS